MSRHLTLAALDGRRLDGGPGTAPPLPIPVQTARFLIEMRALHERIAEATKAAALLVADPNPGGPVAAGLALKVVHDLGLASAANVEAQRLVPHLIGLLIVEAGPE